MSTPTLLGLLFLASALLAYFVIRDIITTNEKHRLMIENHALKTKLIADSMRRHPSGRDYMEDRL